MHADAVAIKVDDVRENAQAVGQFGARRRDACAGLLGARQRSVERWADIEVDDGRAAAGGQRRVARAERQGLWGAEFDMPQQWRRMNGRPQEDAHDAEPGVLGGILGTLGLK